MKVYIVKRNSDLTEGRGPMVNFAITTNEEIAKRLLALRPGIMSDYDYRSEMSEKWDISEVDVIDEAQFSLITELEEIKEAIKKLSKNLSDKKISWDEYAQKKDVLIKRRVETEAKLGLK